MSLLWDRKIICKNIIVLIIEPVFKKHNFEIFMYNSLWTKYEK